nr:uncharacterized protein LOC111861051 isoform X2 [Paramormyrops kingsleyae]XP_023701095.1 uncharacterized protein LOC111861051 isoform X3 [Paramormyrops kingsleyae]
MIGKTDRSVEVERLDIVDKSDKKDITQVTKCPDLESEDGSVEVLWPSKKGGKKEHGIAAKILLLGDDWKTMAEQRDKFISGEDIWKTSVNVKRKRKVNSRFVVENVNEKKKENNPTLNKDAAIAMAEKLKKEIQKKRSVILTEVRYDSEESEYDCARHQRSISKRLLVSDSEDDGYIKPSTTQSASCCLDIETIKALKKLPAIVKSLKDVVSKLPLAGHMGSPPPWNTPSSESAGPSSSDTPASASSPVMLLSLLL